MPKDKTLTAQRVFGDLRSELLSAPQVLVGFSGGLDSSVLLDMLSQTIPSDRITAIHINHGLSAKASQWQAHAELFCQSRGITCHSENVNVENYGSGPEAAARQVRYDVFEKLLHQQGILLLGHHQDDQIETLLYRLMRSSGPLGLSGIPVTRSIGAGTLYRPLLTWSKEELKTYALAKSIEWVEDKSNSCNDYDRNFLRNRLIPILSERWPDYRKRLSGVSAISRDSTELCRDLASQDIMSLQSRPERGGVSLLIDSFNKLSGVRQKNVLRHWAETQNRHTPSRRIIDEIINSVVESRIDASPKVICGDSEYRRYDGRLYLLDSIKLVSEPVENPLDLSLQHRDAINLGGGMQLVAEPTRGEGLRMPENRAFRIANRQGGEHCHPVGRSRSNSLKKCLQEFGLEPWWRDRVPLILLDQQIVAVADLWVCEGWQVKPEEIGIKFQWHDNSL
tara:strand:- start:34 stop:1386 length:1353 start_codon:yes stop_codon:yes gene_type:complete